MKLRILSETRYPDGSIETITLNKISSGTAFLIYEKYEPIIYGCEL